MSRTALETFSIRVYQHLMTCQVDRVLAQKVQRLILNSERSAPAPPDHDRICSRCFDLGRLLARDLTREEQIELQSVPIDDAFDFQIIETESTGVLEPMSYNSNTSLFISSDKDGTPIAVSRHYRIGAHCWGTSGRPASEIAQVDVQWHRGGWSPADVCLNIIHPDVLVTECRYCTWQEPTRATLIVQEY